jgi:hypothetical protein
VGPGWKGNQGLLRPLASALPPERLNKEGGPDFTEDRRVCQLPCLPRILLTSSPVSESGVNQASLGRELVL